MKSPYVGLPVEKWEKKTASADQNQVRAGRLRASCSRDFSRRAILKCPIFDTQDIFLFATYFRPYKDSKNGPLLP